MVTSRLASTSALFLSIGLTACGSSGTFGTPPGGQGGAGSTSSDASGPVSTASSSSSTASGGGGSHYDGQGFVVHEWGTDTVVVGSDGSLQRGLHHEEEDLPAFVYDRIKGGGFLGSKSVEVKMETPVTYFYAPQAMAASVQVTFPKGVFTQWYPNTQSFSPVIVAPNAEAPDYMNTSYADPLMDPNHTYQSPTCSQKYGTIANGLLDWGTVQILSRSADTGGPDAPLDKFSWSYARQVDSNAVTISPPQGKSLESEKFLFYRGLGNFDLPVTVGAKGAGAYALTNTYQEAIGTVFAINVSDAAGAFEAHPEGIAPGATLSGKAPSLAGAQPIDKFVDTLGDAVTKALDGTGLYHDEAIAMVNTWKRQWFKTPGLRVLYLVPQSWTDASIPLAIAPKPDAMKRVMMIRVEVITPELEQADTTAALGLSSPKTEPQAEGYFLALGRFAEPRLRRALEVLGNPSYGDAFLKSIGTVDTTHAFGE